MQMQSRSFRYFQPKPASPSYRDFWDPLSIPPDWNHSVEQKPEQPEPENISQLLLEKFQKIIGYTNESYTYQAFRSYEQDNLAKTQHLKAFKKILVVSYNLIENGYFEAEHNKLKEIYKKVDGKPKSNDFVPHDKAVHLALMLQDLISSFGFEDKPVKNLKKYDCF